MESEDQKDPQALFFETYEQLLILIRGNTYGPYRKGEKTPQELWDLGDIPNRANFFTWSSMLSFPFLSSAFQKFIETGTYAEELSKIFKNFLEDPEKNERPATEILINFWLKVVGEAVKSLKNHTIDEKFTIERQIQGLLRLGKAEDKLKKCLTDEKERENISEWLFFFTSYIETLTFIMIELKNSTKQAEVSHGKYFS